ncbi:DUF4105 domain-containing protein [uncultured Salinisphaera sp.]|uniref:Lnb N-terminal periplasmic domain-containing protein n=1 Tax=uncultured Salinisphaera sp. TaxID=359372 RepID=UPI0032B1C680
MLCGIVGLYATGAIVYRGPARPLARWALVGLWTGLWLAAVIGLALASWFMPFVFAVAGLVFAAAWSRVTPARERAWAADVARVFHVEQAGQHVTIHDVRDFDWHSRESFEPAWVTRTYDLDTLVSTDLVVSYWAGPHIAHALVSFGFTDGRTLCFSVEVRRVTGTHFSALGGLFRQCEVVVIAAEERDIVRTRASVRGERVYLYRVALPDASRRALFCSYLDTGQALATRPRFYNTLTANCSTLIYDMVEPIVPGVPWNWRLLVPGHLPAYLYRLGALTDNLSLEALTARGQINAASTAWDRADPATRGPYSQAIRHELPVPEPQRFG